MRVRRRRVPGSGKDCLKHYISQNYLNKSETKSQSGSTAADLLDGLHALSARLSALVLDGRRLGRDLASVREDFASVERRLDRLGGDAEDTRREVRDAGVLEDLIRLMSYNGAGKVPEGVYIT